MALRAGSPRRIALHAAPWALVVLLFLCVAAAPAALATDPLRSHQWGLDMVEANAAHAVTTGAGAVVAVVDTGVDAGHPDLAGQILPGHDVVDNDDTAQDGNGHGTHVAGIVDALTGNGVGVESVSPAAKVLPVRVLDDRGDGSADEVAAGVNWATDHGADVINLSLGGSLPLLSGNSDAFDAALTRALDRGIVVVAASGNDGLPVCEQPAAQGRLLCVGAVDKRGNRSYFSNFGSGLGLVGPGGSGLSGQDEDVLSTYTGGGYAELAGTSQATPFVSGVAALLVSEGIRGQAAVQRILATARDAGPVGPDAQYGAGIVDAARAVAGLPPRGGGSGSSGSGGPAAGPPAAGGPATAAGVTVPARISRGGLLRSGLPVRCRAAGIGTCAVTARLGKEVVAAGADGVGLSRPVLVRARATRAGRRMLRRKRGVVRLQVTVHCPGVTPKNTRVMVV
jgi:subtilisin family serine protease